MVAKHALRSLHTLVRHNAGPSPFFVFANFLQGPLFAQIPLQTQHHNWEVLIIVEVPVYNRKPCLCERFKGGAGGYIIAKNDKLRTKQRVILGALRVEEPELIRSAIEGDIELEGLVCVAKRR